MKISLLGLSAYVATVFAVALPAPEAFQIGAAPPLPADVKYANLTDVTSLGKRDSGIGNSMGKRGPPPTYGGPGNQRVYYCNAWDFLMNEGCREDATQINTCYNLPGCFTDSISSLKTGPGISCSFYVDANCRGSGFSCSAGCEISRLGQDVGPAYHDTLSSFICYNA